MFILLPFSKVTLADREWAASLMYESGYRTSEASFATHYMWQHRYNGHICRVNGFALTLDRFGGGVHYHYPLGRGDLKEAVLSLEKDAETRGVPFRMVCVTEAMKADLERLFPGRYDYVEVRDSADYLYNVEDMIGLSGKRYHGKRNFINRFRQEFEGRWSYEVLSDDLVGEIWEFEHEWGRKNDAASSLTLRDEQTAITLLLYNYSMLGAVGGALRLDGKIIAFTIASLVSPDTMDIHIEKADYDIPGAYQMIFYSFASRQCAGLRYINREDDMGLPGLRKSKLSYYPADILMKFDVVKKEQET